MLVSERDVTAFLGDCFSISYPFKSGHEFYSTSSLLFFPSRGSILFFCFLNHNQNVLEVFLVCVFVSYEYSFHPLLKTCLWRSHWVMSETLRQLLFCGLVEERVAFHKWHSVGHPSMGRYIVKIMTSLWFSLFLSFLQVQTQNSYLKALFCEKRKNLPPHSRRSHLFF